MKKVLRLLIWFFYNWYWASRIYNEQKIKYMIDTLDPWMYSRNISEIQKAKSIIFNCYSGASTSAKLFFCRYYMYRFIKSSLMDIIMCFLLSIIFIWGCMQIDWHNGKEISLGVFFIILATLMFIVITKECKYIQKVVAEYKAFPPKEIIPS